MFGKTQKASRLHLNNNLLLSLQGPEVLVPQRPGPGQAWRPIRPRGVSTRQHLSEGLPYSTIPKCKCAEFRLQGSVDPQGEFKANPKPRGFPEEGQHILNFKNSRSSPTQPSFWSIFQTINIDKLNYWPKAKEAYRAQKAGQKSLKSSHLSLCF